VGGVLSLILSVNIAKRLEKKFRVTDLLENALLLIALFLTYSRSAYLAFILSLGIIGVLKSKKILISGAIAILLLLSISDRAQERVLNLVHSVISITAENQLELPDATARLRIDSWKNTLMIFQDNPWLGVGYNAFGFAQQRYGFLETVEDHSATGSDATFLTILATTGILGGLAYLWFLATVLWKTFRARKDGLNLGLFAGLCGLLVHSIFVNSLLYTPILIFFYVTLGTVSSKSRL
jgi:O-antigen ligase